MLKNPFQYSISSMLVVTFLVAVGISASGAVWSLIALIEFLLFTVVLFVLSVNFPTHIEQHVEANAIRADGSRSSKRARIEQLERRRFIWNVSVLLFVFIAASNLLMLTLRVDRLFEGETYIVKSPEVTVDLNRKISEAQYARELGGTDLKARDGSSGSMRVTILAVVGAIWSITLLLVPVGYLGMLRTLASEATDRSEFYRSLDFSVHSSSTNMS